VVVRTGLNVIPPARKFPRRKKRSNRPIQRDRIIPRRAARAAADEASKRHPATNPPTMSRRRFCPELGTGRQMPAPHPESVKHHRKGRLVSAQQGVSDRFIRRFGQTGLRCAVNKSVSPPAARSSIDGQCPQTVILAQPKNIASFFMFPNNNSLVQVNKSQSNPMFYPANCINLAGYRYKSAILDKAVILQVAQTM